MGAKAARYKLTVAPETVGIAAGSIVVGVFLGTTFFNTGPTNGNTSGSGGSTPAVTAVPAPAPALGSTATNAPAKAELDPTVDSLLSDFLDDTLSELLLSFSPFSPAVLLLVKFLFYATLLLFSTPTIHFGAVLVRDFNALIAVILYRGSPLWTLLFVITLFI